MKNMYSENVLKNADYFSFFVNLCQKKKHIIGGEDRIVKVLWMIY